MLIVRSTLILSSGAMLEIRQYGGLPAAPYATALNGFMDLLGSLPLSQSESKFLKRARRTGKSRGEKGKEVLGEEKKWGIMKEKEERPKGKRGRKNYADMEESKRSNSGKELNETKEEEEKEADTGKWREGSRNHEKGERRHWKKG